jgi:hypothetical protein
MEPPTTDVLATKLRTLESRVVQLEDAVQIYGPPPKKRRLPIPEISPAQREFLIWLAVFSAISIVTASQKKRWGND